MVTEGRDSILRRLARDQWVRIHGTPRITVLVGGAAARDIWLQWLAVRGETGTLLEPSSTKQTETAITDLVRRAAAIATERPEHPIALRAPASSITAWRSGRSDRFAALLDEGLLHVTDDVKQGASNIDARSAAEAALFEALEATPATTGRFALNESLSVRFGPCAAEIDLLSRSDRIAIELDGFHHFTDVECYRRDRRKDLLMQTQGLLVVRVLAEDVLKDPRDAVRMVCEALAYRRGEARGDVR